MAQRFCAASCSWHENMPHLNAPGGIQPPAEDEFLGVALITSNPLRRQRHVALVYRRAAGDPARLSHLQWDCIFRDEEWQSNFYWQTVLELATDPINRSSVIAFLDRLRQSEPRVPYGFRHQGCTFEIDPITDAVKFDARDPDVGLTCATYVTCVFESISLPFLDATTWPRDRDGDVEWRDSIVANLERTPGRAAHAAQVRAGAYDARIRPEDVASAAIQEDWRISFDTAQPIAAEMLRSWMPY